VTLNDTKDAMGLDRDATDMTLAALMFPLLQSLDEEYLQCDAQFGAGEQREIFTFAERVMPQLDYSSRAHLMNATLPNITTGKTPTDADTKIELFENVTKKIKKAFCEEGNIEHNGCLAFTEHVLFPMLNGKDFVIDRKEEHGGKITFSKFEDMKRAFADRSMWPGDLKLGVTGVLESFLGPIREKFQNSKELQDLEALAYPVEEKGKKAAKAPKEPKAAKEPKAPKGEKPAEASEGKKEKKEKAPKAPKAAKAPAAPGAYDVSALKIVVGTIIKAWEHPESDKLWCEEIDCGEEQPRQIASGLRAFYANKSDLENRQVLVLANLKARKLANFPSNGMVLCASNADHTVVKFAEVPAGTKNGEVVSFPGFEGDPVTPQQMDKKKVFDHVKDGLVVGEDGTCTFKGTPFTTSKGNCTAPGMSGSHIA